ncbi:hypothetical protein HZ84_003956 [Escherichia coli]|nr:hypothetical protein [Escherichia coli]EIQ9245462.1 hypothetical protein [Escherichia coli]
MMAQQLYAPELEAPTLDVMERAVNMFAIMTNKTLTSEEGFQFLTLWTMVNKAGAQTAPEEQPTVAIEAEPAVVIPELPATNTPATPVAKASSEPVKIAAMPAIEEINIPGLEVTLRKVQNFIKSQSKYWMEGYPWRISVEPFDRYGEMEAYYVHFQERPTPEQFAEHYAHYLSDTNKCRVHLFESDGTNSRRITDEYCSFTERGDVNYPSDETLVPRLTWRDGERFRIRFFDERIHKDNFIYYPHKPHKSEVNRLSTLKKVAIVEARRAGND